jgi:uncharacterized protein YlaN (UPF0358 family)
VCSDFMFDPTIYENLKVVIEGVVYDRDLQGTFLVTHRKDLIDISTMSRSYMIEFMQKNGGEVLAEIRLHADLLDLAAEILEISDKQVPGCRLEVEFRTKLEDIQKEGKEVQSALREIWGEDITMIQHISYILNDCTAHDIPTEVVESRITLDFNRKIDEDQLHDMEELMDHIHRSLLKLNQLQAAKSI